MTTALDRETWDTPERTALRRLTADFTRKEIVPHLVTWERDGVVPVNCTARRPRPGCSAPRPPRSTAVPAATRMRESGQIGRAHV